MRTSVAGGGPGVERPLHGGSWDLEIDLVPPRTAVPMPDEPGEQVGVGRPAQVPARTFGGFEDLVPIGQARVVDGAAVCLWALERYHDRSVLSVGALVEEPLRVGPITPGAGRVEVWDDRGHRLSGGRHPRRRAPGVERDQPGGGPARRSRGPGPGLRLVDLPGEGEPPRGREPLDGPFAFGVALPPQS